jgi:transcriptional regulator of aroF, aroG, tyrA and aromatic amino acid transport
LPTSRGAASEAVCRSRHGAHALRLAGQHSPAKNAVYRALTQLEGYELRPQDILLPDYDAGTVSVGEEAMEGSLDDITSRFERSVLTQLYRSYPSTRKLAKRLGVSHTAIANKLREYGLNHKKGDE